MNWYYAKNGNQQGPLPTEDMKDRIAMGEISATDLAWCEGMGDWAPIGEIPQLKVEVPAKAEEPGLAPVEVLEPSPYSAPVAPAAAPVAARQSLPGQPLSQGLATASLVCGILSLIGCCLWPVSGPLAVVAIVLGFVALGKAKSNPAAYGGKGMAKSGLIIGFLGLLATLVILGLAMWVATMTPEEMEEKIISRLPEAQRQEFREKMEAERAKQSQP
jgi:uncharacterized membrane protein YphA (DoxX/SURF4 family)